MKKPERPPTTEKGQLSGKEVATLLEMGKWDDFLKLLNDGYPYWEDLKYKVKGWDISQEEVWRMVKNSRNYSKQYVQPSHVQGFMFTFNLPVDLLRSLHELDMSMGGILQSENESLIPSEEKDRYLISSLMEEAIASSQIEGAVTTRKIAREMLEKSKKPKTESERMIVNNYEAMKWIVKNSNADLTPDSLLLIHSMLTNDTLKEKKDEGAFRDNDNVTVNEEVTNEVFYEPPSYKYLNQLIHDFCEFANKEQNNTFIHPIIKGIILHFLIGYIHPFADGNGRTARAIFYWYLIRKGYWLVEYMSISRIILKAKAQYAKAYLYTEYDENDLTYFILYNIKAIKTALSDLKKYIQEKKEEKKNILAMLKNTDFNDRQFVLIKDILQDKHQYFTVKEIELRFNVSNQTARNDLTQLTQKKILFEKKTGKKIHFFPTDDFEKILKLK